MHPALIVIIAILAVAGLVYSLYASSKRRQALAAWAQSKGLSFDSTKDPIMDGKYYDFKCLNRGHSRYAYNIMKGNWAGREITAFDYHYATGSGRNRSDHYFSAVILQSPIPLKPLYIRREHFFDKLTEFIGFDDIDFESADFSKKFYVKSPDKKWAYDVIHQRMMEYLLTSPQFNIEFGLMHVIAWRNRRFKPQDFEDAANLIKGIFDRFPDYLIKQQLGQA